MKKLFDFMLIILSAIALVVSAVYIVHIATDTTQTTTTVYIGTQDAEELPEGEEATYFLEANYYSNNNENGIALQELKFNFFTDYAFTEQYSVGMQKTDFSKEYTEGLKVYQNSDTGKYNEDAAESAVMLGFNYYESDTNLTWGDSAAVSRSISPVVSVNNEPYKIKLTGYSDYSNYYEYLFGLLHGYNGYRVYYTYADLFNELMEKIETNNKSYGTYIMNVKLSEFFTLYKFNEETTKYEELPGTTNDTFLDTYITMKFNYSANGATSSSQSLFGLIDYSSVYGKEAGDISTDYWKAESAYEFGIKDLSLRYSSVYEGSLATLGAKAIYILENSPEAATSLVIDTNSDFVKDNKLNIVGLDYSALKGIRVDSIKILGNIEEFSFLTNSLLDAGIKTIYAPSGTNLIFAEGAGQLAELEVVRI